ncbi:zinc finger protein 613-like isoform X2 [Homalodisca vitripennis]|nr:zinc finger protein 613-like isoform X2 [Homalodisca vitripennis]XP_046665160.1 zinc finger protein 613-like isoform X2 [Homalodisca vitripennis]
MAVPMQLGPESRVQIVSKLTPASVGIHTEEDEADIMGTHYIPVNVQRVSDSLTSKVLGTDSLHGELLTHQVVDLAGADFVQHTVPAHYYDTDDILSQEDLTEEDRRLAAALVAVQFVQQQKQQQQTTVLTSDLLDTKPIVTLPNVNIDKPMTIVNYMQEEEVHQQLMEQQSQERMLKIYQNTPQQEIKLQHLPPLKKVLSNQSMIVTSKYNTRQEEISQVPLPEKTSSETIIGSVMPEMSSSGKPLEEVDSDYDVESRPSHRSLPHKKRIPRKLKAPSTRNIHTKCYKCNKCGETFTTQAAFSAHRLTHASVGNTKRPANNYSCELCNKQFGSQLKFFEHLKSHYEPGGAHQEVGENHIAHPLTPTIQDSFSIKSEFQQVGKEEPQGCVGLPCSVCGKVFRRQKALESHMSVSHPRDNEIEEFSEPEDMMEGIRHVVNIGSGDEDHCDDKIRQWRYSELGMELQDVCLVSPSMDSGNEDTKQPRSPRGKQLSCPQCDRSFNHRNSLLYHIRSHSGQRPHQCEVCGKSFLAASALKVHMRLHSGDKPYKCDFCGKTFRQWGDLKYHVTSLHSDTKQFQCEYCGKDFARKYSLIVHRRIHTGEKNYTCEYCNKTFRASSYLQNHRRIHTGEKPHSCDVCGKPFRVRSDMKRHRTTHSGDKRRNNPPPQESLSDVEAETILPDCSPLNLNVRSNDSDETLVYRECMERETVFLWIPNTQQSILSDE